MFDETTGPMTALAHAHAEGLAATRMLSRDEQKTLGQFMTPQAIANFMAERAVEGLSAEVVRILEPAAGAGILAVAAVEALLNRPHRPRRIELLLWETDGRLIPTLNALRGRLTQRCRAMGVTSSIVVNHEDFLLSELALTQLPFVDLVIANPPYFKLGAADGRASAHGYAVHGQPNIYGLFMAACASLLRPGGRFSFITPRSWMSGSYFRAVRQHLFKHLQIEALHSFESRQDHFTEDEVLQEAVITWASAETNTRSLVTISSSAGMRDLDAATAFVLPRERLISPDADQTLLLPRSDAKSPIASCTATLATHQLKVSTGPVIAFRAEQYVRVERQLHTVPLLWMQHVRPMSVHWPINKKREHVVADPASAWMLIPNEPMVLLRRFSPKEDPRRIMAAPYFGQLPGAVIGLENHLNFICRVGGRMTAQEVTGLAGYLNSDIVDVHFRAVSGNTQVNAAELRKLPIPSLPQLNQIGARLGVKQGATLERVDVAVSDVLCGTDLLDASLHSANA